ncbi:MAG: ATP-binding protein [Gammaproteobacteria bacterium]|nr:ATP-binding protein [Gammaproteobacteria bacterium]
MTEMEYARVPDNENDRLTVLYDTDILDTPAESTFDAITSVTANICATPLSFICLVDSERVWFKSSSGIDGISEVNREIAFCPYTIMQDDVFEVQNASMDPRFKNSPMVTEAPNLQYYAGAPLVTSDGFALGTLCVMDYKPRELDEQQKQQLKKLALTTTALIEAKRIKEIKRLSIIHRLGDIVEISSNEIYLIDAESKNINYANRAAQLNLGYSSNTLSQLEWGKIVKHAPISIIDKFINTSNLSYSAPIRFQAMHIRNDGSEYPVECTLQNSGFENNEFIVICTDISQRKNAENRERILMNNIAHMDRINATGALASGLAHELNQPLTAVTQYCDTALIIAEKYHSDDNKLLEALKKAATQTIRAGEIVKRFRAFTEKRLPSRSQININELLEETLSLVNHDIVEQNISLDVEIQQNIEELHADSIQIQQVLLNIITNSIQAMEKKFSKRLVINCANTSNNQIQFTISDTGDGIDDSLLDDLITPIPSKKPNGTGLGLCVCKYIIESHNGQLWSDTDYTDGARIIFSIPSKSL